MVDYKNMKYMTTVCKISTVYSLSTGINIEMSGKYHKQLIQKMCSRVISLHNNFPPPIFFNYSFSIYIQKYPLLPFTNKIFRN